MASETPPGGRTQTIRDLQGEDRRRQHMAERRDRLRRRLAEAFQGFPGGPEETERARLVEGFLGFVADNVEDYATRVRVANPETGGAVEEEWVVLCGGTIRSLDVPARIRRLILEAVLSLLPQDEHARREALARAAGLDVAARASTADLKALQKKGMLGAFGGKLLVDTKHLISEHSREETEAYFAAAQRIATELEASLYQTGRDQRFLDLVRQRYHGGLVDLVDAQRGVALEEIARRDSQCPLLERHLRNLLETPDAPDRSRSLDDWYISARIAFQAEHYVYARIDELRSAVKARLVELDQEPMLNPEAALEDATPPVAAAGAQLEALLGHHGAPLGKATSPPRLDLMQVLRENAALLGRPEVVPALNELLARPGLVEQFARLKIAAFRQEEPDRRKRLQDELVMWDELFRSAPLGEAQRRRLDDLREELLAPWRTRGTPLPEDLPDTPMLLPFGKAMLARLQSEDEFVTFERWLRRVRGVYSDRSPSDDELPVPTAEQLAAEGARSPTPTPEASSTAQWYPTLVDVHDALAAAPPPPSPGAPGTSGDAAADAPQPPARHRDGWLKRWFGAS